MEADIQPLLHDRFSPGTILYLLFRFYKQHLKKKAKTINITHSPQVYEAL